MTSARHDGSPFLVMELLDGESLGPIARRAALGEMLRLADELARRARRGARPRHHPSRHQARQPLRDARRPPQGPRLRSGQADRSARSRRSDRDADRRRPRCSLLVAAHGLVMGTVGVHVAGTGARRGRRRADAISSRSGVVLYEMVTGQPAFLRPSSIATLDAVLHEAPPAPVRLNPGVSPELERIIERSLEKDRELRYQTAGEMRAELRLLRRSAVTGAGACCAKARRARAGRNSESEGGRLTMAMALRHRRGSRGHRRRGMVVRPSNARPHAGR